VGNQCVSVAQHDYNIAMENKLPWVMVNFQSRHNMTNEDTKMGFNRAERTPTLNRFSTPLRSKLGLARCAHSIFRSQFVLRSVALTRRYV
jgi:hypothetical protein